MKMSGGYEMQMECGENQGSVLEICIPIQEWIRICICIVCVRLYLCVCICVRLNRHTKYAYVKGNISTWKARKSPPLGAACLVLPLIEFPLHEIRIEGIVCLAVVQKI